MATKHRTVPRVRVAGAGAAALQARLPTALAADSYRIDSGTPDVTLVAGDSGAIREAAVIACPVLAVVPAADRRTTTEALDAGAAGVVLESELESSLGAAIRAVCSGLVVVPAVSRQAVRRPMLTSREKQILSMVVVGLTNAEIARRLYLAESTIKSHLSSIFGKLGVRSRKEAADLILDPSSGLGAGILGITPAPRSSEPYTTPVVA